MATIPEAFAIAVDHHRAGRLQAAEQIYRQILALEPNHAEALHLLGLIAYQVGKHEVAVTCIGRAIELKGNEAAFHSNLGEAYRALRKLDEALVCCRRALEINPDFAEAHYNLAIVLREQGKLDEAVACYRRALEIRPRYAEAYNNLGNALQAQGELEEALACYRQALEINPKFAAAYSNLGNALKEQGKLEEAIACCRRAVEIKPTFAEVYNNLGVALQEQGKLEEALACYRRALEIKPDFAEAHCSLGNALDKQGRLDEAVGCFRRALQINPHYAEAYSKLGNTLGKQRQPDEAVACFRRAVELKPNFAEAHYNFGNFFKEQGKLEEAIGCYRRALEIKPTLAEAHLNLGVALKDQGNMDEAIVACQQAMRVNPNYVQAHSNLVYDLRFSPDYDAKAIYEEHLRWNARHAAALARSIRSHSNDRDPQRRLRIGYVSPNFWHHAEAFFIVPLLAGHDHQTFEIFCYADVSRPDRITAQLRTCADVWRDIAGLTDEQLSQLVRQDGIDILVDLTMHMACSRLLAFARKPAPVQVCWLAYQGTTGLATMDYRLTDQYVDPPGLYDRYYVEESIRLPDAFGCYDPLTTEAALSALPALDHGRITFGSLNNFCKVNPPVLGLWSQVLKAVDGSRLLLRAAEGSHRGRTLRFLEEEGIAPERVTFVGWQPHSQYLELYRQIDIGLDTLPYNGQTTTLDSLWMGVPVITLVGQTAVGRAGMSLLTNLGRPELIAESPEQFVRIARELAGDLPRLGKLRSSLRGQMQNSPLMDGRRFARHVEAAYRQMWQRWCALGQQGRSVLESG
jgi:predicted O-linked N-acetylglucosamine transferase (SPINDLY family)